MAERDGERQPSAKHRALKHCVGNRNSCLRDQSEFPIAQNGKRFQTFSFPLVKEVRISDMTGPSRRSLIYMKYEDAESLEDLSNRRKLTC